MERTEGSVEAAGRRSGTTPSWRPRHSGGHAGGQGEAISPGAQVPGQVATSGGQEEAASGRRTRGRSSRTPGRPCTAMAVGAGARCLDQPGQVHTGEVKAVIVVPAMRTPLLRTRRNVSGPRGIRAPDLRTAQAVRRRASCPEIFVLRIPSGALGGPHSALMHMRKPCQCGAWWCRLSKLQKHMALA